jgi:hypothetical protein
MIAPNPQQMQSRNDRLKTLIFRFFDLMNNLDFQELAAFIRKPLCRGANHNAI